MSRIPMAGAAVLLSCAVPAHAGVYRCAGADGKVLYSNAPCEDQGAKTAKTFSRNELRPNTVKMPKAPPPEAASSDSPDGPGGLVGALRQKPVDVDQRMREGDPAKHPKGGVRNPVLERLPK